MATIPAHLLNDREWRAMLHLFLHCSKLQACLTNRYIDLNAETVNIAALKKLSAPWLQSEKFMLNLALHCFNDRHKVDLGDMDYLDDYNKRLAFEALHQRYG